MQIYLAVRTLENLEDNCTCVRCNFSKCLRWNSDSFIISSSSLELQVYASLFLVSAAVNVPECTASHHVGFNFKLFAKSFVLCGIFRFIITVYWVHLFRCIRLPPD